MKRILLSFSALLVLSACGDTEKSSETAIVEEETEEIVQEVTEPTHLEIEESTQEYGYEVVVPDLTIGWGMAFLPDGSMLITEKSGEIIHFKDGEKQQVEGLPEIYNRGQGGLLDIAVHPDYENNGWIYLTYSSPEGEGEGGNTALARAKLNNSQLVEKEVLYKAVPNSTRGQHFGSRIAFDEEGYLYFSIGDRGNRDENPQDITRDGGKIYRLNPDGTIPNSNPFVGEANAKEAVYSYGHRNPQGMTVNPETNNIWVHEHGPQGGDEINIVQAGANYGWPVVTFGENYDGTPITENTSGPEFENPLHYWLPSIAPSGMLYVTSEKYPHLNGNLLVGSLKFQYLEHLILEDNKVVKREKLLQNIGRVRAIEEGPDDTIYISIEGLGIVKLIKK